MELMSPDLQWLSAVVVYIDLRSTKPTNNPPTSYPKTPRKYLGKPCGRGSGQGPSYHHLHPVLRFTNRTQSYIIPTPGAANDIAWVQQNTQKLHGHSIEYKQLTRLRHSLS